MTQQLINIGSSANKGDGDAIRTAFDKVNDNFTELYLAVVDNDNAITVQSVKGDVIGQDSTVIVNASTNTFNGDLTGSVFADDSTLLVDAVNSTISWAVLNGTPTTLAGYGISDAATSAQGALAATALQAETITLATLKTEVAASADFADFQTRIAAL